MKRRKFLSAVALGTAGSLALPPAGASEGRSRTRLRAVHSGNELKTSILIEGLAAPVKVLQVTDTHISCDDASDRAYDAYSTRMRQAFVSLKHHETGRPTTPVECLKELMRFGVEQKVDLLALTGDIVNYPSATAVEFVRQSVAAAGIPHVYTAGNHDWHYEGMEGTAEQLRREWREKRLKPLYEQTNLSFSSVVLKGLNFVTLDNSTYQVDEEQLAFFERQVARNLPLVLLVHIPLYVAPMRTCCGHPDWGAGTDKNFTIERRQRWPEKGNQPSTMEFVRRVRTAPSLAAVLTGHWHSHFMSLEDNLVQYVTPAGFNGRHRLIEFLPLNSVPTGSTTK